MNIVELEQLSEDDQRLVYLKLIYKIVARYRHVGCDIDYAHKLQLDDLKYLFNFLNCYYAGHPEQELEHKRESNRRRYSGRDVWSRTDLGEPIPDEPDFLDPEGIMIIMEEVAARNKIRVVN